MKLELVIHPRAVADVGNAVEHYERERQGLGMEFADAVEAAVMRARRSPLRFAKVACAEQIGGDVRRVRVDRFPYVVVFEVLRAKLRVLSVAHERQEPGTWRNRIVP